MSSWRNNILISGSTFAPASDAMSGKTVEHQDSSSKLDTFEPNPLNKFASYNYLFTLSSVTRSDLQSLAYLKDTYKQSNIIARSGGIGGTSGVNAKQTGVASNGVDTQNTLKNARRVLEQGYDLFFESVEIKTIPSASEDRIMTPVTRIQMVVHEPFGLSFVNSIRAAAANAGYLDHIDAPYLFTIDYKGFDDNGTPISIGSDYQRKIPVKLIRMAIDVNQGGSIYTVDAIPYNEFGFVNRFNYTRSPFKIDTSGTLSTFCKDLTTKLNVQTASEEKAKFFQKADSYVITCDPKLDKTMKQLNTVGTSPLADIRNANIEQTGKNQQTQSFGQQTKGKTPVGQVSKGTGISAILSSVMKLVSPFSDFEQVYKQWETKANGELASSIASLKTPEQRLKFLEDNEDKFYIDWFRISSNVFPYDEQLDNITKKQRCLIHYHIEPYRIHILNLARPGLSSNIRQFWNDTRRYIARKKYDYIFTGNNTEIIDLNIKYNVAYYSAKYKAAQQQQYNTTQPEKNTKNFSANPNKGPSAESVLKESGYVSAGKTSTVGIEGANSLYDEFIDSFANPSADMVRIDMEVRGDPIYLSANQFNSMKIPENLEGGTYENDNAGGSKLNGVKAYDSRSKSFNLHVAEPYVLLNFKAPVDLDLETGMFKFNQGEDIVFNGLYRVVTIENIFNQGRFTQRLALIRLKGQGTTVTTVNLDKVDDSPAVGFTDLADPWAIVNDFSRVYDLKGATGNQGFDLKEFLKQKILKLSKDIFGS